MDVDGIYIVSGDVTCDQKITIEDLVAVQSDRMGLKTLTGDSLIALDTNNDGSISSTDRVMISQHLRGRYIITGVVDK